MHFLLIQLKCFSSIKFLFKHDCKESSQKFDKNKRNPFANIYEIRSPLGFLWMTPDSHLRNNLSDCFLCFFCERLLYEYANMIIKK